MNQGYGLTKPFGCNSKLLIGLPEKNMIKVWGTFRVGIHHPIKYENLAVRHDFMQMIKRPPIAKTQLEDRARGFDQHLRSSIQAVTLGFHTANKTIETAHGWDRRGSLRLLRQCLAQLLSGLFKARCQFSHNFH